jgi:predicted Zn-dependent peptidase
MQKIEYQQLQETVFHETLPNGLKVYILPKAGFYKTYAVFTTRYGSIDNTFQVKGKEKVQVPDGIAHFLEHKLFEQPDGTDVFEQFSRQGASANAFTTFTRTAYLFSCTDQVEENLETLINFVQTPYFTDQTVEKEKGIIGQEIRMYEDNPDWRSYMGLLQSMYARHPVRIDIAGTVESIGQITKEALYTCYHTFYHPSNMVLFVVGAVDPEKIMQLIRENQAGKQFDPSPEIVRFYPDEPDQVVEARKEIHMAVAVPKCLFGFKEKGAFLGKKGNDLLKLELATNICLEALLGPGSDFYQSLYDEGLINDSFGFQYTLEASFAFSMIGGDTRDPDRLLERVNKELPELVEKGLSEEEFERIRKKKIGEVLRYFNSAEWIANQFTSYRFLEADILQLIPVLEQLTLDEVNRRMREHVDFDQFAVFLVLPVQ